MDDVIDAVGGVVGGWLSDLAGEALSDPELQQQLDERAAAAADAALSSQGARTAILTLGVAIVAGLALTR